MSTRPRPRPRPRPKPTGPAIWEPACRPADDDIIPFERGTVYASAAARHQTSTIAARLMAGAGVLLIVWTALVFGGPALLRWILT